jgi:hypothetical protein
MGRLPPVGECLYGISLVGLGLTRILPFKVRGAPRPGAGAYREVRPKNDIPRFPGTVSNAAEIATNVMQSEIPRTVRVCPFQKTSDRSVPAILKRLIYMQI